VARGGSGLQRALFGLSCGLVLFEILGSRSNAVWQLTSVLTAIVAGWNIVSGLRSRGKGSRDDESAEVAGEPGQGGSLTAAEIAGIRFTRTRVRPGYVEEDVDNFLEQVKVRLAG
jgi:DivIVA domain-containing protein